MEKQPNKKKKNKMNLDSYFEPTPRKFRQLGDALLSVSTFVTGYAVYEEYTWLAFTSLIIGSAGKFLTNFFSERK